MTHFAPLRDTIGSRDSQCQGNSTHYFQNSCCALSHLQQPAPYKKATILITRSPQNQGLEDRSFEKGLRATTRWPGKTGGRKWRKKTTRKQKTNKNNQTTTKHNTTQHKQPTQKQHKPHQKTPKKNKHRVGFT